MQELQKQSEQDVPDSIKPLASDGEFGMAFIVFVAFFIFLGFAAVIGNEPAQTNNTTTCISECK